MKNSTHTSQIPSFTVGARGSQLSLAQTGQVISFLKNQIEADFSIKQITTTGDRVTDKPLSETAGQNFFTKEIDAALLRKDVHITCHSYKDLSYERPAGIRTLFIPQRHLAHDVLFFRKDRLSNPPKDGTLKIGSSSPRRKWQILQNLPKLLPVRFQHLPLEIVPLRGNVPTRLKKLSVGDTYDGIVLALSGIERLIEEVQEKKGNEEFLQYLNQYAFMALPLSLFPTAASQGCLILECLEEEYEHNPTLQKIFSLSHVQTMESVQRERKAFHSHGGSCHMPLGIHVRYNHALKAYMHFAEGTDISGELIQYKKIENSGGENLLADDSYRRMREALPKKMSPEEIFVGLAPEAGQPSFKDTLLQKKNLEVDSEDIAGLTEIFVTSRHCLHTIPQSFEGLIIAAGISTQRLLANRDFWVSLNADSLGMDEVKALRNSRLFQLFAPQSSPTLLTVQHSNRPERTLGCYKKELTQDDKTLLELEKTLSKCSVFYWSSFSQFEEYQKKFPFILEPAHVHCHGLGKTWVEFNEYKKKKIGFTTYGFYGHEQFLSFFQDTNNEH